MRAQHSARLWARSMTARFMFEGSKHSESKQEARGHRPRPQSSGCASSPWLAKYVITLIRTLYGDGLPAIVGRKDLLEILKFRNVIDHDVGPVGVLDEKV